MFILSIAADVVYPLSFDKLSDTIPAVVLLVFGGVYPELELEPPELPELPPLRLSGIGVAMIAANCKAAVAPAAIAKTGPAKVSPMLRLLLLLLR